MHLDLIINHNIANLNYSVIINQNFIAEMKKFLAIIDVDLEFNNSSNFEHFLN